METSVAQRWPIRGYKAFSITQLSRLMATSKADRV
jgi:hypothetical protein